LPLPPRFPFYQRIWLAHIRRNIPRIDKENASYAKHILTNSYFSRENIMRAYGRNSFVSYPGIDTSLFRPLALPQEDFVLSVGACLPHKGFDFMVRSLSFIEKRRRPKIVVVSNSGNPAWETHVAQMAAAADVDLQIKKLVADAEIVRLYNQAKLFVYTAILEPFGLAPLEAMACGTPVVAVKEGGVRETVIHNETGILTDRDEQAFATAVSELLSDDRLRERMGDGGVEAVRSLWTLEQAGARVTWHLNRALSPGQLPALP
jgi:glycosyltransferase involved in cell wall biosynthesis